MNLSRHAILLTLLLTSRAAAEEPIYPDSVPGVGPIRAEDWFVKGWDTRRAHFREQAEKQHGTIVFFGDSITQGWGDDFRAKFGDMATIANSDAKRPHPDPL